jgi:hypothetical protein
MQHLSVKAAGSGDPNSQRGLWKVAAGYLVEKRKSRVDKARQMRRCSAAAYELEVAVACNNGDLQLAKSGNCRPRVNRTSRSGALPRGAVFQLTLRSLVSGRGDMV